MFPRHYKGTYVDVGAHHPYRISNTYLLFKAGWHGINIDANPITIKLFEKARPNDKNVNVGIAEKEDLLPYHRFADPASNTFSDEEAEKWKQKTWNTYLGTTEVKMRPLRDVLSQYMDESQQIDVMNVDVEGYDMEVLRSNDWERFRPKVIVIEDHQFSFEEPEKSGVYVFLNEEGYTLKHKMKFSLIFELQ